MLKKILNKGRKGEIPKSFIRKFLPDAPVIIEAGAHVGIDTLEMSRVWPKGSIHAFEPVPDIFAKLAENTKGLRNVKLYQCALGAATGTARIFVSGGTSDGSSSLLEPKEHLTEHPEVHFNSRIEIPVMTLDDWSEKYGVRNAHLLWLDMQGNELAAMKAGERILGTVRAIHIEVSLKEVYRGVPLYPEVRQWLEARGFKVVREELPWPDMGNVLFVRA